VNYYREIHEDQTYSGSGTNTLEFTNFYYDKAVVNIMEQGDYYAEITAKDLVSNPQTVTYRLKDNATNALVAGTADIEIIGY